MAELIYNGIIQTRPGMRVIAGSAKGKRLKAKEGLVTRPTSARVREAIFDILAPYLEGSSFLDLYAGSGAVAIEALSRGAGRAVLVDHDPTCRRLAESNLRLAGLSRKAEVRCRDVGEALLAMGRKGEKFDLVFLDPPYQEELVDKTLKMILLAGVLRDGGLVLAEHGRRETVPGEVGTLQKLKHYRYGDTMLSLYRQKKEAPGNEGGTVSR